MTYQVLRREGRITVLYSEMSLKRELEYDKILYSEMSRRLLPQGELPLEVK